jgi:Protein of unknown function (DUF2946)
MRVRRHKYGLGLLGVLAILSNVLAGALCHMPSKAADVVDDVLGALVICTSDGATGVPHGRSSPEPDKKSGYCASCTLIAGFALVVTLFFAAIAFPPLSIGFHVGTGVRTLADHLSLGGIRSRAPPAFA